MTIKIPWQVWAGAAVAGAAVVGWSIWRSDRPLVESASTVTKGAAEVVGDVAGGVFQGLASVVGVPTTGQEKCCNAIAKFEAAAGAMEKIGAAFDVSAHCPSGDYVRYIASRKKPDYCQAKKLQGAGTW